MLYFIPNTKLSITAHKIKDATDKDTTSTTALKTLLLLPVNFSIVLFLTVFFFAIVVIRYISIAVIRLL